MFQKIGFVGKCGRCDLRWIEFNVNWMNWKGTDFFTNGTRLFCTRNPQSQRVFFSGWCSTSIPYVKIWFLVWEHVSIHQRMGCFGYQKIVVFPLPETVFSQFAPETLGLVQMSFPVGKASCRVRTVSFAECRSWGSRTKPTQISTTLASENIRLQSSGKRWGSIHIYIYTYIYIYT